MYNEGDKVYFKKADVWGDDTWYEGIIHQPYKNLPVFSNEHYSIIGTNIKIHCFADEKHLKPRIE